MDSQYVYRYFVSNNSLNFNFSFKFHLHILYPNKDCKLSNYLLWKMVGKECEDCDDPIKI